MKTKIALCEDNENFRESLKQFIADTPDFSVIASLSSAQDIIAAITENTPDLILMDIDMPGMTGIDATRLVKSHFPNVQVIILTVYEDDDKIFKQFWPEPQDTYLRKHLLQEYLSRYSKSEKVVRQ
jgi:DNA-binding NarL/FixJ family response regulator